MDIILILIIFCISGAYFGFFHAKYLFDENMFVEYLKKSNWYYQKQKQCIVIYPKNRVNLEIKIHIRKILKISLSVFLIMLILVIISGFEGIILCNMIIFPVLFIYKIDSDMKKKAQNIADEILMQCPELFYQMSILVSSGLNIDEVMKNIYENTYEEGAIKNLLDKIYFEIERGESLADAVNVVARDLNIRAINKFSVIVKQMVENGMKKGNEALMELSDDTIGELQFEIRQKAEKLSSKLMLPLMISLGGLMLMLIVPIMMQM